jgi:hypothetical protein
MSKNGLHRHYDKLEPEERFRLDLLAMARGDAVESERLVSSCPKRNYRGNDRAFAGRWSGAILLTTRVYIPLADYLAKLQVVELFRQAVPDLENLEAVTAQDLYLDGHNAGARHAWREAKMEGDAPEWSLEVDEEAIKAKAGRSRLFSGALLDTLEKGLAQGAFTLWVAFAGFCAERIGVEAKKVLAVASGPGPVERVEGLCDLAQRLELEADPETVQAEREELERAWAIVEDRGV